MRRGRAPERGGDKLMAMSAPSRKPREEVLALALALEPEDREELAYELLRSLEGEADEGVAEAWLAEVRRRSEEVRTGKVELVPWDEVKRKARALLARRRPREVLEELWDNEADAVYDEA